MLLSNANAAERFEIATSPPRITRTADQSDVHSLQFLPTPFPGTRRKSISMVGTIRLAQRKRWSCSSAHRAIPYDSPTSNVLGQVSIAESSLTSQHGWNTVMFPNPVRDLVFNRRYALVWAGTGGRQAARLRYDDSGAPAACSNRTMPALPGSS